MLMVIFDLNHYQKSDMGAMALLLKNYATNLSQSSSLTCLGHLVIVIGCHHSP